MILLTLHYIIQILTGAEVTQKQERTTAFRTLPYRHIQTRNSHTFSLTRNTRSNFCQLLYYFAFLNSLKYVKDKIERLFKPFNDETTVTSMLMKSTNAAQNIYLICLIWPSDQKSAANAWDDVLLVMFPGNVARYCCPGA